MKKVIFLLLLSCLSVAGVSAQVTGTKVIGTDYATLAAAIADLNANGISGNVVINVPAGYTETAPVGGYLLGSATLNASTSATSTLTIQKSGATANPVLTAPAGTSASLDGIFFIQGTDYVTINGIDLAEAAANTTATTQMEFGYALVKRQAIAPFDGCQNVTIKNCTITLNILNAASIGIYANNHTATSTTLLTITATTDAMNNCVFSSNTIQNCNTGVKLTGYASAASPYTLYDQNNTIGGGSTVGNTIQNFGANAVVLSYENNATITYNTINNIAGGTATSGGGVGINVGTATNASATVSNNTINLTIGTGAGNTYGIYINCAGTGTVNLDANTITASGGGTGGFYMIFFATGVSNLNVTNNNFSNINVATTGFLALIMHSASASTFNMYCNGNYTSGTTTPYVSKTGAGNSFYGYYNPNASTAGTSTISNNNFSNITLAGATQFIGIYESNNNTVNAGMTKFVSNNVVSNISTGGVSAGANYGIAVGGATTSSISNCQVSNMNVGIGIGYAIYHWACTTDTIRNCHVNGVTSTGSSVYGITLTNTSTTTRIYNDTLNGLSTSSATGIAYGVYQSGAVTAEIYKNSLYDISATGSGGAAYGLYLIANANIVSNNLLADIRTPNYTTAAANFGTQLVGIWCGAGTNYNLYYNTVYLNGTSTGTNFGSSAVYAATGNVTLNNNIFINTSTPAGTGMVAAYRRSATGLTGYQASSNNNLFYAGTPASNSVIMYDGTVAYQTLAAYKALVTPRDAASVTENVTFQSVTGGTAGFLKPSTTVATQVESNGINIPGFTDDIYGTVRAGNTGYAGAGVAPDLGAVEADYTPLDLSAPSIIYTPLTSTCASGNRTITATITDVTGVPVSGTLMPRIYYKKGSGTWYSSAGALATGTGTSGTWTFTITATDMGGVTGGDVISYFVVAQDGASTPNLGSIPVGIAATDVNTITTYPATPNTYGVNYTLSGSYNVGVGGDFATITAAANAYSTGCLSGPVVFNLISATYPSETFPITFSGNAAASATNTLTIRPATGMTPTITGSGAPVFSLDGAQYVTIDGRAGGVGTKALTISNTTTNAANIRFINGASYDTIKYCTLVNVNTATNTGTIFFTSSAGATGNSNNVIDNCDFVGGATPYIQGIYSNGTAGKENINNTVSNCNFADFFSATVPTNGIYVTTGSSAWTITGNRFYQTAARTYTSTNTHRAIYINVSAGNGFNVTNNIIGYASSSGTGTYAMGGAVATTFNGIELSVGTTTPSSVQGNTITNISLSGTTGTLTGIHVAAGSVNVGTIAGNTVGSPTSTGAITVANTTTVSNLLSGIASVAGSPAVVNFQNNNVGGITVTGTGTIGAGLTGIWLSGSATVNVSGNTIGSTTTANSLNSSAVTTGSVAFNMQGINSSVSSASTISNNTIANINSAATATTTFVSGILHTGTGAVTISGNTIKNISSAGTSAQLAGQVGVNGIAITNGPVTVSQNTISAIMNTNATSVQSNVVGIGLNTAANASILANRIYDLRCASTMTVTTTPPTAIGIQIYNPGAGTTMIANNMISLGNAQTTNTEFMGIMNNATSPSSLKVYYNSINIEGAASSGALPTMGFNRGNYTTTAVTTPIDFKNNIIRNVRTGGTGKHYAIVNGLFVVAGSNVGWSAAASNNNILNAATATVGYWSADQTMAGWKTASASDANSYSGATLTFTNTVNGDLHLNMGTTPNVIESHGATVSITNDYDGDARPGPAGSVNGGGVISDIGADEFDGVSTDDVAPAITYTILPTTCSTGDRTLTATILDQSGVPAAGSGTEPRIYYKKGLSGTWYSQPGTLSSGTVKNGTWSFPIVSLDMGGVSGADKIYYYVVAQDVMSTPNISASPSAGLVATSVISVTTAPTTPNNYFINYTSGTFNVGAGQTFTTITDAVNSYNANTCLTGPVTFLLTDAAYSASETFPITINNNALASSTVTLTIKPGAAVAATVTDLAASPSVFKLLNARYVTIDGVNTGGASLTLNNMNTGTAAVVWLASTVTTGPGCKYVSLLNTTMNGGLATNASNWGIIACVDGATPTNTNGMDNDSITVQGNYIKKCGYSMWIGGTAVTAAGGDDGWIIRNNLLGPNVYSATDNLGVNGSFMRNMQNSTFSGNTMQNCGFLATTGAVVGMYMESGLDGVVIDSNVFDTVVAATNSGFQVCALYFNTGNKNVTISRNKITAMYNLNTGGYGARGIVVTNGTAGSNFNIVNNFISDVVNYSSATVAQFAAGISVDGTSGGVNIYNNSINLFGSHTGLTTATSSADILVTTTGTGIDVRNNVLVNSYENTSSTLDKTYAIYSSVANTVFSNVDYNDYYCTGGTPLLGNIGGTDRPTLADMITGFGGNTHSINNSVPFVGTLDLHVPAGTASSLESAGVTIAGVTNDIDGQVRPGPAGSTYGGGTNPDMGADEFDGIPTDATAPVVSYTVLSATTCVAGDRTLSGVAISDASGVPTTGTLMPRIYFKKNAGSWYSAPGILSSGTATSGVWSFTISATTMGGLSATDVVSYYVAAQDNATTPNVGSFPVTGFTATGVNTVTTAPTTPSTYTVAPTLNGSYTVGAGGNYTTITAAVNAYNTACLTGSVTFVLTDAAYSTSETFPLLIKNNTDASSTNTLTIKPATGVAASITGTSSSTAIFKLLNARYITIDGLNTGGSSLTLNNGNSSSATADIWLASTVTTGPGNKNISLLNMNMNGGINSSASSYGIIACVDGAAPAATNGMDNDSVTIQGNYIKKCGYAIYAAGTTATAAGGLNGWVMRNNILGPTAYSATDNLGINGMFLRNMTNVLYTGNTMQNVATLVGMYIETGVDGIVIDSNITDSVFTTTAPSIAVCAYYLGGSVKNVTISRNKISSIYALNATGYGARGITVVNNTAASNVTIVNNFISDLISYSNTTVANWVAGIGVDGSSGGVNIWNNSINLFGPHVGLTSATGSAGITVTSTGTGFDVRNNVLVNTYENTSSTTDKTYAIYSTAASTAFTNIDYNDYYCTGGTPVLGYVGATDRPALADMIAGFGGNTFSINESVPFVSNTDLHIPAGTAIPLESSGVAIAGVTTDIDGQVRPGPAGSTYGGAFNPDMGADEFDGISMDGTPPLCSFTALSTITCSTADRTISGVTISDASGIPITGSSIPRIYFKKNVGTWYSAPGALTSGTAGSSVWSFTISPTTMGGVTGGDVVSYYVAAQDVATIPNVGGYPVAGLVATDVNTVTTPPTTPFTYTVAATLSGSYNVGVGGDYTTLTSAVNAYNTACLAGAVTFVLTDATYPSETYPITIAGNTAASSANTLTIQPAAGVAVNITSSTSAVAVFKFLNAKYVTIDGLNTGGSSMAVTNNNTTTSGNTCDFWLAAGSAAGSGNSYIALKNMNITGGAGNSTSNQGIVAGIDGASPASTAGMDNDNITISGNTMRRMGYLVRALGTAATSAGGLDNWTISNNIMGPGTYSTTDNIGYNGMYLTNMLNLSITGNTMQNIGYTTGASYTIAGIYMPSNINGLVISGNTFSNMMSTGTGTSTGANMALYLGTSVINATITGNKIQSLYNNNTAGYGARAIIVNSGVAASNTLIANNAISDVYGYGNSSSVYWPVGIDIEGATGGVNVYYNSVNLSGAHAGLNAATSSACLFVNVTGNAIDVRDNIFSNSYDNSSSTTDKGYTIYSASTNTVFSNIDYNDYYVAAPNVLGYIGGDRVALSDIVAGFGGNTHSINAQPIYVSPTDLHLQLHAGNLPLIAGTAVTGVTTDIDGTTRGTTPVMGADEVVIPNCSGMPTAGTVNATPAVGCGTFSSTLGLTGSTLLPGTTFQWETSTDNVTYTPVSGATSTSYAAVISSTVYYRATLTCTIGGLSASTAGLPMIYTPFPDAIAGPATVCTGNTISLTSTTGGGTWSSGTTSVATVSSSGLVTGVAAGVANITYTASGCSVASNIAVTQAPTTPIISNTAPVFCSGLYSTLSATSTNSVTPTSGAISVTIPDNSATGASTALSVAGIPAGAVITSASVNFNVTMSITSDINLNLTAPNGNTINLVHTKGGSANFTNTKVSSAGTTSLASASNPYSGTYAADFSTGTTIGSTAYPVTSTTWASLYSVPNGSWILSGRDVLGGITGTITSWSISISYTMPSASFVWSPTTDLYTDAGLTTPYTGTGVATVYAAPAAPSTPVVTTYSVVAGCSSAGTTTVTANPLPANIAGSNNVCVGSTTTLSNDTTGGTWSNSLPGLATIDPATGIVNGIAAGGVTMSYTKSATGCFKTMLMTVNPLPTAIAGTTSVCESATTTLADVDGGGTWSSDGTTIAVVAPATGVVTGVSAGFGLITYTLPTGCQISRQVTVNPAPITSVSPVPGICFGSTTTLTANTTMNNFALMSQDFNAGLGAWTITNIDGNTDSYWQLTTPPGYFGATGDGSQMIQAAPDAYMGITNTRFTSPSFSTVGYGAVTLSFNEYLMSLGTSDDAVDVEYSTDGGTLWSPVFGQIDSITGSGSWTSASPEVSVALPAGALGQANVKLRWNYYSNQGLTWAVDNIKVTAAQPAPGYTWSGVAGATGLGCTTCTSVAVTPASSGPNGYNVVATTSAGCVYTASSIVTVNPLPSTIGGTLVVCQGDNTIATDVDADGTWSTAATAIATIDASTGEITGVAAGTAEITYTLPTGCTTTAIVTVNATPVAIDGIPQVCQGLTTTLSNSDPGGTWSTSASSIADVVAGVVSGVSDGTATISYSFATGCASTVEVVVNPLPASIGGSLAVCEGLETTLTDGTPDGTWSTASSSVASIGSASGIVTGNSAGTTDVTYTLPTGCISTATVTVNHTPAAIDGIAPVCVGLTTTLSNVDGGGTWSSSATSVADIDATGIVTGMSDGNATITYTLPAGCIATAEMTVNPLPATIGGTLAVCEGLTTTLTDGDAGGNWSSTSTAVANIGSSSGVLSGNSAGTTDVTYTLPTGCITTATVIVNHTPAVIGGVLQVCQGLTTTLSNTDLGGTWGSSATSIADIDASGVVSGVSAGTATITYTLPTGCINTAEVTVNPLPAAIGGTPVVCEGLTTTLTESTAGGTWSSSSSAIASIGSANGVVIGNSAGTTDVTYRLSTGCITTATVTVNSTPASIGGVLQVCEGVTTTLSDTDLGGTWSSSATSIANIDASGVVSGLLAGSTTITYTLPTSCITTSVVTVNPMPGAIGGTMLVCQGVTSTLSNATTGGTWSSGSTTVASVGSASGVISGVSAGFATITYMMPGGCYMTANVTVNSTPAAIAGVTEMCAGSGTTLTDSDPGGSWASSAPGIASVSSTGIVSGLSMGTVTISYSLSAGCVATTVITVDPLPAPIAGPSQLCEGTTGTFTNGTPGGTWASNTPLVATIDNTTGIATAMASGNTLITYTSAAGCVRTRLLTVNPLPANITGPSELCMGSSITLADATTSGSWSCVAGSIATISSTGILSGINAGVAPVTYTLPTGCATVTNVTVNQMPSAIGGTTSVCKGQTTTLSNGIAGGTWSSGTPANADVDAVTGVVTGVGVGSSVIIYTLPGGCSKSAVVVVNEVPSALVGASNVCQGATTSMSTTSTGGVWTSSTTSVASINLTTGVVTGLAAGTANISYTMLSGGCYTIRTVSVDAMPAAFTGAVTVCSGQVTTLSSTSTGGSWSSSNAAIATVGASGDVVGVTGGTSVITYALPSGCMRTTVVTVNSLPTVYNVTGGGSYCSGAPGVHVGLDNSNGGVTYQLYSGAGAMGGPVVGVTGLPVDFGVLTSVGSYSVRATSASTGCMSNMSGTATVSITASVPASVSFVSGTGSDTVCSGLPVTFTATATNGGTPVYQWMVNGIVVPAATTNVYTHIPATGDVVVVNMSSSIACATPAMATATRTLIVNTSVMPVAAIAVTPGASICAGSPVTFSASALYGGSSPVYMWVKNGSEVAIGPSYSCTPVNGDNVVVKLAGNHACALADTVLSSVVTMTVNPVYAPVVSISVNSGTMVQAGTSVTMVASVTNGGPAPEYQWYIGTSAIMGATSATFNYNAYQDGDSVSCMVRGSGACGQNGFSSVIMHVGAAGVGTIRGIGDLRLMPNPNKGEFAVKGTLSVPTDKEMAIDVTNMLGQVVYRTNATAHNGVVDVKIKLDNTLANGMYMLNLIAGEDRQVVHFVLEQ